MSGFGTDGLHDEQGAVNFHDAATFARGEGVTGVTQRAFQSTPSSRTRPVASAVTGVSTVASRPRLRSPLVAVGALRSFLARGLKASRQRALTAINTAACTRNDCTSRQLSRAAALPTANQMETRFQVMASSTTKPMAHSSQKMGSMETARDMHIPPLRGF